MLNEAEISLSQGEIPGVLKQGLLDYFIRRLVGEIEGEHRVKPYLAANAGWDIDIPKYNRLHRVLDLCRGKFGAAVGDAVRNIVMIWIEVRGELSGADLSGLDLSGIPLNGVRCSRFYEDQYLAANFSGSRVHEKNLLPRGHLGGVYSAVYSPDGKQIISASRDGTIKQWDAATGKCIKTNYKYGKFLILAYPPKVKGMELRTSWNEIYVPAASAQEKARKLINIPGLFIQGCSFENLEKGSEWSEEGLAILKQYHAKV